MNTLKNIRELAMELKREHPSFPMDLSQVENTKYEKEAICIFKEINDIVKEKYSMDYTIPKVKNKYMDLINGLENSDALEYILKNTPLTIGVWTLSNKYISEKILREYAEIQTQDETETLWCRRKIICNPNTPEDIIKKIIDEYTSNHLEDLEYIEEVFDDNMERFSLELIIYYLYKLPKTVSIHDLSYDKFCGQEINWEENKEKFKVLIEKSPTLYGCLCVTFGKWTNEELLDFATHSNPYVKMGVVMNPTTDKSIIRKLTMDDDERVSTVAIRTIEVKEEEE